MGEDKKYMLFQGVPLIQRVYEKIKAISDDILIVSNSPDELEFMDVDVFSDLIPDIGPIGGLFTAMEIAKHEYVAVIACDLPFVSKEILFEAQNLLISTGADVAIPKTGPEYYEPLHAVYLRKTCKGAILKSINNKEYRLVSWLSDVHVIEMSGDLMNKLDPNHIAFMNINTKQDYNLAEKIANDLNIK